MEDTEEGSRTNIVEEGLEDGKIKKDKENGDVRIDR